MPSLGAAADHVDAAAENIADVSVLDEAAAGLYSSAEEGIGRSAEANALFLCEADELLALLKRCGKRLFGVHVLSRLKSRLCYRVMVVRFGDVEHDIDIVIRKKLVHIVVKLGDVILFDSLLGALADKIADADDLYLAEHIRNVLEIDLAYVADSDKRDSHVSFFFSQNLFLRKFVCIFVFYIMRASVRMTVI